MRDYFARDSLSSQLPSFLLFIFFTLVPVDLLLVDGFLVTNAVLARNQHVGLRNHAAIADAVVDVRIENVCGGESEITIPRCTTRSVVLQHKLGRGQTICVVVTDRNFFGERSEERGARASRLVCGDFERSTSVLVVSHVRTGDAKL